MDQKNPYFEIFLLCITPKVYPVLIYSTIYIKIMLKVPDEDNINFDEDNVFEIKDDTDEASDDELLTSNVVAILEDPANNQFEKVDNKRPEIDKKRIDDTEDFFNIDKVIKKYNCSECKKQFKLKTSLDLHVIRTHSGSTMSDSAKLICTICNKVN